MEGEDPEQQDEGADQDQPVDGPSTPEAEKSKSKSPTPEVIDNEKSKSKSPTPEVSEFSKSKSKSPTPGVPEFVPSMSNKSTTPEVIEFDKGKSKSPTPETDSPKNTKSITPIPENLDIVKSKSSSPSLETSPKPQSKSITPKVSSFTESKAESPVPDVSSPLVPKSKSMTPESVLIQKTKSSTPDNRDDAVSRESRPKSVKIGSESATPKLSEHVLYQSKSTYDLSDTHELDILDRATPETVGSVTPKKKSPTPEREFIRSKSKSPMREVSFAEGLKSTAPQSQMSELRPSILSGGTSSTTNSGTPKARKVVSGLAEESEADGGNRSGPGIRGGSLAVFRGTGGPASILQVGGLPNFASCFLQKRSPFIHNPPQPEERRPRIQSPRTPKEYIINLREDLADFQESHGLPRTRDYSFLSLGLALAQETCRSIYSLFLMFTELFPIVAIVSLILRFALDKLIEILETTETVPKVKKSIIFALEMIAIIIPLWILIGTIIIPLLSMIFSIFKRMIRFKGGKKKVKHGPKPKPKAKVEACTFF